MLSTRRSLFSFGVMFAALALVTPESAFAQPTDVMAEAVDHQSIKVSWTLPTDNSGTASWEILYQQVDGAGTTFDAGVAKTMAVSGRTTTSATVSGLTHMKRYIFVVRAIGADGARGTDSTPVAEATTEDAPMPSTPRNIRAMGGDETFMLSWDEPFAGHSTLTIKEYHVQKREVAGSLTGEWVPSDPKKVDGDETMITFEDLENGTTYEGRVRAVNSADKMSGWTTRDGDEPDEDAMATVGEDDGMTETPALPLVGILLLGAGLVAAGRRRLRQ